MKGKLVILSTGSSVDVIGYKGDEDSINDLVKNLENDNWYLHNSILIDSYRLLDCRGSQTKMNRMFCYRVFRTLEEGANIILVVPNADIIDKRLREKAIIFSLPKDDGDLENLVG